MNRLKVLTGTVSLVLFAACLFASCEQWNSYCFNVNNLSHDSLKIKTSSLISDYIIQIHNSTIRDSCEQGYSVHKENPSDTIFIIPPRTSFSAIIGWYSRHNLESIPERDGVVPLWTIIDAMFLNEREINSNVWNNESKWKKNSRNTDVIYDLDIIM